MEPLRGTKQSYRYLKTVQKCGFFYFMYAKDCGGVKLKSSFRFLGIVYRFLFLISGNRKRGRLFKIINNLR